VFLCINTQSYMFYNKMKTILFLIALMLFVQVAFTNSKVMKKNNNSKNLKVEESKVSGQTKHCPPVCKIDAVILSEEQPKN
jgi:hypothetical protein